MKKILAIFAALVLAIGASAQNYEYTGPFGMPYVNINAGAISPIDVPTFSDFLKGVRPTAGLELGTYFTPIWGASVEGISVFNVNGAENDPVVGRAFGILNGKVNISNLFGDYKGYPRRVELVGVAGAGYGHNFAENAVAPHSTVYKAGAELNFNLGEKRAWQINVRPTVLWNKENGAYTKLSVRDANAYLNAGLTYKFGNRRVKSHNFVTNNYAVSQADYDALLKQLEAEKNKPAQVKEVVKETIKTERVIEKETKVLVGSHIITFPIGSCVLSATEKAKVAAFAKSLDNETLVKIVGSADSKTGSESRNKTLAKNRANVVKNVLVKEFGIGEGRIVTDSKMDVTDNPLTSRSAILTIAVD